MPQYKKYFYKKIKKDLCVYVKILIGARSYRRDC